MSDMISEKIPVIAVVGPTASGKTGLAISLAKEFCGEVISADSMQIYSEISVGTARPSVEEMQGIPHHLMGFVSINRDYSVVDYVNDASQKIREVYDSGKLPILCGGTGLYIDSLLTNTEFAEIKTDLDIRESLYTYAEEMGNEALFDKLCEVDPEIAEKLHPNNLGRVVRALEVYMITGKKMSEHQRDSKKKESPYNVCYIGTNFADRKKLYERIEKRIDMMLENGLMDEAMLLFEHGEQCTAAQAIGYKEFYPYFTDECSLEEAVDKLKQETRHYAKRQLTWFRRNKDINWLCWEDFDSKELLYKEAKEIVNTFLSEEK